MFRILQSTVLIAVFVIVAGCVTWRDSSGRAASSAELLDCDQKCGDSRVNRLGSGFCVNDCMSSKGYSVN
jgi:hypothetical protein